MCVSDPDSREHTDHTPKRTVGLQDSENLVTGDEPDLGDTVRVTEDDTDLGRRETALRELEDLVRNVLGRCLGPRRLGATVRQRRAADTLSGRVHAVFVSCCSSRLASACGTRRARQGCPRVDLCQAPNSRRPCAAPPRCPHAPARLCDSPTHDEDCRVISLCCSRRCPLCSGQNAIFEGVSRYFQ